MNPQTRLDYAAEKRAIERIIRQLKSRLELLNEILGK